MPPSLFHIIVHLLLLFLFLLLLANSFQSAAHVRLFCLGSLPSLYLLLLLLLLAASLIEVLIRHLELQLALLHQEIQCAEHGLIHELLLVGERDNQTGRVVGSVERVHYYVGPLAGRHIVHKGFGQEINIAIALGQFINVGSKRDKGTGGVGGRDHVNIGVIKTSIKMEKADHKLCKRKIFRCLAWCKV